MQQNKVLGRNVIILFEVVGTGGSYVVEDNLDGTQDVTFTYTPPAGAVAATVSYFDGTTWHDNTGSYTSPRTITIPKGDWAYKLIFQLNDSSTTDPYDLGGWKPFLCGRSASITFNTDFIETSVSGSGKYATYLPTKHSVTASMEGLVSLIEPDGLTIADVRKMQLDQTVSMVKYQRTDEEGNTYSEQIKAYISGSSDTGSFEDANTFSLELRGTGAVTQIRTYI